jgi:hypothetical protein
MAPVRRFACCVAICAASLAAAGVSADDAAVEQPLNDVYTQLRRTLTPAEAHSLYVSTLGLQFTKGIASISRFDHKLELINAKAIIGAEASFQLLTCGPGVNLLSYEFSKPFRGVGSAVNENLELVDGSCPWTRGLNLVMEHCSYSSTDVQCKEEPLDVEPVQGTATPRARLI